MIRAVTFDYWNTLVYERGGALVERRMQAWAGIAEEEGIEVARDDLLRAHSLAFGDYQQAWVAGRQFVVEHAVDRMLAELAGRWPRRLQAALVESFSVAGLDTELHLVEGVGACLRTLRERGVRLGIVCDVGLTPSPVLRAHLDRWGLLQLFDGWSFSDEVGWYKPAPEIFVHALAQLDCAPGEAAHVGDRRRTDVGGALGMGMHAVRFAGVFEDDIDPAPEADLVIRDYSGLADALRVE